MANPKNKFSENVDGTYYVDEDCTACELCISEASDNFKMNEESTYAFVYKQPENRDEEDACNSAMENCPSGAIGNDG